MNTLIQELLVAHSPRWAKAFNHCGKRRSKRLKKALKEVNHCMVQSLRHPRTPIVLSNPGGTISPIPWWGSVAILIVGIASWVIGSRCGITGLDEAGRAMVYLPLGNLFGLTVRVSRN